MSNKIILTEKQQIAYDAMKSGKNVFITGPGGVGKSIVIKKFFADFKKKRKIAMTSTTGISAILIGGVTLHSYLGIGLGKGTIDVLAEKILSSSFLNKKWNELETLIIDEVSMLSPELFDKLEKLARIVKRGWFNRLLLEDIDDSKPFGGIQLILSGDFLQLPVVNNERLCFESKAWKKCVDTVVYLTEIIRQDDYEFQNMLNEIRYGTVSEKTKNILRSCIDKNLENDIGIKPTQLKTTNSAVDIINQRELNLLKSDNVYEYELEIEGKLPRYIAEQYKKRFTIPQVLKLCVGAQVMLMVNLDVSKGLANGSRGIVVGFDNDLPVVQFLNSEIRTIKFHEWDITEGEGSIVKIYHIPLRLAWCCTIHKVQGSTIDYAIIDLNNVFEYGQTYVALSRVKNIEGLSILNLNFDTIKANPKAITYYKKLE